MLTLAQVCYYHLFLTYRDLHTFPTRRSSDLRSSRGDEAPNTKRPGTTASQVAKGLTLLELLPYLDRKSTRLNSSHLVISYAVFCLKKKSLNHTRLTISTVNTCNSVMIVEMTK